MRARIALTALVISVLGLIATFASGLYEQDLSRGVGVSRIGYGFPLSWHGHSWVVYPGNPTIYWFSLESFVLDTVFWCLILASLTLVAFRWLRTRE
jgi:hypothetical protein